METLSFLPEIQYLAFSTKKKMLETEKQVIDENDNKMDICAKAEETPEIITNTEEKLGMFQFRSKIVWFNALGFLFMHLCAVYGVGLGIQQILQGHFATVIWMSIMTFVGGEGITIGAHRLWSHKSYKARLPLRLLLIAAQTIAGQNCLYIWARDHRQHHKYSDTNADPHNAQRGFWFSHIGWLMMKKHPEVIKKGKGIDMSDLEADPIVMFQKKYYKPLYVLLAMFLPISVPCYFWNETLWNSVMLSYFTRYVILLNVTWSVNSVAHLWGTKPYDRKILPVESYFVSFIGLGEGWHNYHHAFPWDYKASEFGMNLNGTTRIIELFAKIGWAYDLKEASHDLMTKKILRTGDGSHPVYGKNYAKVKPVEETQAPVEVQTQEDKEETVEVKQEEIIPKEPEIIYAKPRLNEVPVRRNINRVRHG